MKVLIASDLHGSLFYTNILMSQIEKEKVDRIVLLGDILYHGPRNDLPKEYNPKEVIKLLNECVVPIISVRGNCDTEVDQMVLNFPILSDYIILIINNKTFFLTHGHLYNETKLPPHHKGDIIMCGHTHIQKYEKGEDYTYVNVGSVSIPKENGYHGYVIIENNTLYFKNLDGEIIKTYQL